MKQYRILVTGVGAIIGYGIISSIRQSKYDCFIVGMDIFPDASGQVWCDEFKRAILAADDNYIEFLKGIIDSYGIDLVFFGTEQEIQKCFESKEELGEYYKKLVVNTDDAIILSEDKWNTMKYMKEHGINSIPSSITMNYYQAAHEFGLPLLMKPRRSYASKGIKAVSSEAEFNSWRETNKDQFMVQKFVGDEEHEFTAATFGFGDGRCVNPIIMRRKLSKAGATDKAIVEINEDIKREIVKICKALKPVGPTNFQFRQQGNEYYLLEINPRISSSTSIRTAFGYNEAEMCIEYFIEGREPVDREIKTGRAYRYITEAVVIDDSNNL